jgi:hypothetical protein
MANPRQLLTPPSKCICGGDTRQLATNLYQCKTCGRAKWGDERIPGQMILWIVAWTVISLIVMAYVGISGVAYR